MSPRKYGTVDREALAHVGTSKQDETLRRQFLHVVRGADREHGPHAADLLGAYIDRAKLESGYTFVGLVARLIEQHAHAEGW